MRGTNWAARPPVAGLGVAVAFFSPLVIFWLYGSETEAVSAPVSFLGRERLRCSGPATLHPRRLWGPGAARTDPAAVGQGGSLEGFVAGRSWFLPAFCCWFSQGTACSCGPCQAAYAPAAGMLFYLGKRKRGSFVILAGAAVGELRCCPGPGQGWRLPSPSQFPPFPLSQPCCVPQCLACPPGSTALPGWEVGKNGV